MQYQGITLRIKLSERSFMRHFDDSMSSFSREERIKLITQYIPCKVIKHTCKGVIVYNVNSDKFTVNK